MNRCIAALLVVFALLMPLSADAQQSKITLQYTPPARPADVLTLTGKQSFNRGQMRNIAFYIGDVAVAAQLVSTSEVLLVVPDVDSGLYPVKVVKHDRNPGRDIVLFSQDIEIEADREQILATTQGVFNSGPGEIVLPGVITIEAAEDSSRPTGTYTIDHVESRSETATFKSLLVSGFDRPADNLPPLAASTFVRITASADVAGFLAVRMPVSSSFLATIPAGLMPEIYATVYDVGADDEVITGVVPLKAAFDAVTQTVIAPLPAQMFTSEEVQDGVRGIAANAVTVKKVTLQVSVQNVTAPICFSGQVFFPGSPQIEATARDLLNMHAKLTFQVPERLNNPTILSPPFRTGSFGGAHKGVDLRSADGDALYAATDGTVADTFFSAVNPKKKNWQGKPQGGGWTVLIDTPDGRRTGYAHMLPGSILVSAGDSVVGGQTIIGAADSSGGVSAPHLHLSYTVCDTKIDAWPFLQAGGPTALSFYDELSMVTAVNGVVVTESKRHVSDYVFPTNGNFTYQAPVDLGKLSLTPGTTVPLEIRLVANTTGKTTPIYKGKVKIKETALRAVLTWDTAGTDVDLHVTDSLGHHAFYGNKLAIPNGVLDYDDVDGFGPETFTVTTRPAGVTYTISVHYYSDHGHGPTTATVKVYLDGALQQTFTTPLTNGQTVTVGTH
jgi:murein DD-endopeptidase MepM/ murein hydrolase activator NlpD